MPRVTHVIVTERNERVNEGSLLYCHTYPHAICDDSGRVERFEQRVQRCGIVTVDGKTWHFTVPKKVEKKI